MNKQKALAIIDKLEIAELRDVISCLLQVEHPSDVMIYSRGSTLEWTDHHRWQPEFWDKWREWASKTCTE